MREMQSKDAVITKRMECIKSKILLKSSYVHKQNKRVHVLLGQLKNLDSIDDTTQILLTECMKTLVLENLHDQNGHQGIERTFNFIRQRCYWPKMFMDIKNYCKMCERCEISKILPPKVHTSVRHL